MINEEYKKLFNQGLEKLMTELDLYSKEDTIWLKHEGINNSAGILFLHLCGNLQHFIGAVLGHTEYVRDVAFEFSGKVSIKVLKEEIIRTQKVVNNYFERMQIKDFEKNYPLEPFGYSMTVGYFLNHLLGHLQYHLGQINYHRRLLS